MDWSVKITLMCTIFYSTATLDHNEFKSIGLVGGKDDYDG